MNVSLEAETIRPNLPKQNIKITSKPGPRMRGLDEWYKKNHRNDS